MIPWAKVEIKFPPSLKRLYMPACDLSATLARLLPQQLGTLQVYSVSAAATPLLPSSLHKLRLANAQHIAFANLPASLRVL
jgi:hypothetical protein